jgi:hypothetical protein
MVEAVVAVTPSETIKYAIVSFRHTHLSSIPTSNSFYSVDVSTATDWRLMCTERNLLTMRNVLSRGIEVYYTARRPSYGKRVCEESIAAYFPSYVDLKVSTFSRLTLNMCRENQ